MTPLSRIGIIGLGRMGLPMARYLVRAGFNVAGFDRDPVHAASLMGAGGEAIGSVSGVGARSEVVIVMVADDAQVRDVTLGRGGLVQAMVPGGVIVISSTVKPSTCREVAEAADRRKIAVLDAPVALGQRAAEEGRLTVFAGGPRPIFERCRPVFQSFAHQVEHIDERIGSGQVAKLANNLILWAGVVAASEALAFAEQLGVSPGRLRSALMHGSADGYALRELHLINLTWPLKDIEQALESAADIAHPLPLAGTVGTLIRTLTKEELRRLCRDDATPESSEDPGRRLK